MKQPFKKRLLLAALGAAMNNVAAANGDVERLGQVSVIGGAANAKQQSGSVQVVTEQRLEQNEYTDIHRILREVPGVNIQEEDGFGLRPNIGLRGTGVSRSSNITLMEDGVLIAPAPYASPAAYYFPSAPRIAGVEVSKGPAAIQYGPRTLGGAVNLLSRPIPAGEGGGLDLSAGQFGNRKIHGHYGASGETFGSLLEVLRFGSDGFKNLDNGGNTGFDKNDVMAKFRINSAPDAKLYQELSVKLGYADETSNMSYLGLTEEDFEDDPYRRYAASQEDVMENDHTQIQLNHYIELSDAVELDTVVYRNDFNRNWYKVDKVDGEKIGKILTDPALAGALAVTRGEAAGTVDVKANNREYYSQGVQAALGVRFGTGAAEHRLTLGARYHEDEMDRYQWVDQYDMDANGNMTLNSGGVPGTESNRVESAKSLALYAHDKVSYGKWGFQGGVRFENIDTRRVDYGKTDPGRNTDPEAEKNHTQVWVPGLGATYQATDRLQLLAGVHKGFAPAGPGDSEAEAEESVNYELGARWNDRNLNIEVIGFYNDYSNLLGSCTAASGSDCDIGDQFNAGEVDIKGLEATVGYTLHSGGTRYPLRAVYTYADAEFQSSFEDGFWGTVESGDKMPYLAPQQLYLSAGVEKSDWSAYLSAKFMDEMRTEAGSGAIADDESVAAHTVFDLAAHYNIMKDARAYLKVENLTDESYMVSRRPAGVRAGMPRTLTVGYKMDF